MPTSTLRRGRWLTAASMLAAVGLAAAGCSDPAAPPQAPTKTLEPRAGGAPTRAAVPGPAPRDRVVPGSPLATPEVRRPVRRPNILLVTADDATRSDLEHMPNLRRLVTEQGVEIDNGVAPSPMCVPARASLLTGQYAHNHGALTIEGEGGGFAAFDDADTLPVWLQDAGYDTLFVGKYLNGYGTRDGGRYVPPGWTSWRASVDMSTYNYQRQTVSVDGTPVRKRQYSSDRITDLGVELLDDPARGDRPWYLWVNYVAPHVGGPPEPDDPRVVYPDDPAPVGTPRVAERHRDLFSDLPLPEGPSTFEEDVSDKGRVRGVRVRWSEDGRAQLREARQQRLEALQSVDEGVARLVRTLRARGQLGRTYVVFESDNGYFYGEHNLGGKLWHYRENLEVPMVVRGPGLPRGVRVEAPVTQADWAPTFAAMAGARPGREVDGVDVLPWLADPDAGAARRVVPVRAWRPLGGTRPLYSGVWVGDWTYVRFPGGEEEVYDLRVDPYQLENLAADERYAAQVAELRRLHRQVRDCAGAGCPTAFYG